MPGGMTVVAGVVVTLGNRKPNGYQNKRPNQRFGFDVSDKPVEGLIAKRT